MSSAVDAVDAAANAPLELVNSVTTKVRNAFKPRRASDESVALGQEKAEGGVVKNLVGASVQATGAAVAEQRTRMQERKSEREQRASEKQAAAEQTADVAASMNEAVTATGAKRCLPGGRPVLHVRAEGRLGAGPRGRVCGRLHGGPMLQPRGAGCGAGRPPCG